VDRAPGSAHTVTTKGCCGTVTSVKKAPRAPKPDNTPTHKSVSGASGGASGARGGAKSSAKGGAGGGGSANASNVQRKVLVDEAVEVRELQSL
jgi:hypothetical protein